MKTKTLLIAAAMFLALSAVAFSQAAVYTVSSTPVTTVIATGNAELAGDITFTQTGGMTVGNGTNVPNGTITIQYGGNNVNITSVFANSMIANCTGGYLVAGVCSPTVLTGSSIYQPGLLVIQIPFGVVSGTFTVTGVRVQIDGTTLSSLNANISATGNQIAAGSTSVTVINSIAQGLAAGSAASYTLAPGTVPPPLVNPNTGVPLADTSSKYVSNAVINANNGNVAGSVVVLKVGEGFLGAWSKTAAGGVGVRIQVSATPPKGVTFAFPQTADSYDNSSTALTKINNWTRGSSTSRSASTSGTTLSYRSSTTSSLQVYYYVATDVGSTVVETLEIPVTIAVDNTSATFPLPGITFTYTFNLAPVQGPYGDDGTPAGQLAPRFAARTETAVGPATLAQIVSNSTTLLVPYAYASTGITGDFQTALAISNTSEDPGTAGLLGLTGAISQTGPLTFYLFPGANSSATFNALPMFTYTTKAGSPGSGLDASGNLAGGGTYIVFLNQIFPLATPPTGSTATLGSLFQGYVMIVTPFSNAHGMFLISDFSKITYQSSLMIVLANRNTSPEQTVF